MPLSPPRPSLEGFSPRTPSPCNVQRLSLHALHIGHAFPLLTGSDHKAISITRDQGDYNENFGVVTVNHAQPTEIEPRFEGWFSLAAKVPRPDLDLPHIIVFNTQNFC